MKQVEVYTDGACSGNPGPGGWGAVLRYRFNGKVYEKELSGGDASTTNNRMELTAFIEALRQLKEPCEVRLCSDSQYVINGLEKGWARGWKRRGWKKSDGSPALNPDLVSRGFVYVRENESLMDGAQSIVETALDRCVDEHVRDWNSVKTRVREALSSYIYRRTKRSPMILPILMEV